MSMAKLVHPIPLYHTVSIHTLIHTVGIEFLAHRNVVQYHAVHCPLMRRQVRPHERPTENPSVSPTHTKCPCTRLRSPTVSPAIPSVTGDVTDVVCSLRGGGMSVLFTLEYPLQCD